MDFQEFCNELKSRIEEKMRKEVRVFERKMNNSVVTHGFYVVDPDMSISSVLYFENWYKRFQGGYDIETMVNDIIKIIEEDKVTTDNSIVDNLTNFEIVKNNIIYGLVNYEKNKERLNGYIYETFLDLAKVYYVRIKLTDKSTGKVMIRKEMLRIWGVDENIVKQCGEENTPEIYPVQCLCLQQNPLGDETDDEGKPLKMISVSNVTMREGAGVMVYPDMMKKLAEKEQSDLFIIPSSVHEVLVVPYSEGEEETLLSMIKDVNSSCIDREEVLSDSLYVYHRSNDLISLA